MNKQLAKTIYRRACTIVIKEHKAPIHPLTIINSILATTKHEVVPCADGDLYVDHELLSQEDLEDLFNEATRQVSLP